MSETSGQLREVMFFSQHKLAKLHSAALSDTGLNYRNTNECRCLYRNAKPEAFEKMLREGVMATRPMNTKKYYGRKQSPAHAFNMPKGLFFCANIDNFSATGEIPAKSLYGPIRLCEPVSALLDIYSTNLYFLDYYTYGQRYVIIMAAENGDAADNFGKRFLLPLQKFKPKRDHVTATPAKRFPANTPCCTEVLRERNVRRKLLFDDVVDEMSDDDVTCDGYNEHHAEEQDQPELPEYANPFLYFDEDEMTWRVSSHVWVEVYYTRDVDLTVEALKAVGGKVYDIETDKVLRQ